MRIPVTERPLWFGRHELGSDVLQFAACHRVVRRNDIPSHSLPVWEMLLVERGKVALQIGQRDLIRVGAGQMLAIAPRTTIVSADEPNIGRYFWIGLQTTSPMLGEIVDLVDRLRTCSLSPRGCPPAVFEACHVLFATLQARDNALLRAGASMRVAGAIVSAMNTMPATAPADEARSLVQPAIAAIVADPARDWSVEALARIARMSRSAFSEAFARATGEPPGMYVNQHRMERARQLLADPRVSITEVSRRLGFSSTQYFASVFRRLTGQTPTAFRSGLVNRDRRTQSNEPRGRAR